MFFIMCLLFAIALKTTPNVVPFLSFLVLPLLALWISFSIEQAEQQCWGHGSLLIQRWQLGICGHRLHGKNFPQVPDRATLHTIPDTSHENTGVLQNW